MPKKITFIIACILIYTGGKLHAQNDDSPLFKKYPVEITEISPVDKTSLNPYRDSSEIFDLDQVKLIPNFCNKYEMIIYNNGLEEEQFYLIDLTTGKVYFKELHASLSACQSFSFSRTSNLLIKDLKVDKDRKYVCKEQGLDISTVYYIFDESLKDFVPIK